VSEERPRRRRDPARKERILAAAAELVAARGYAAVGMADVGAAAGIVGSGVYRYFAGKAALLAALLEQIMGRLEHNAAQIVSRASDDRAALSALVRDHVRTAVADRRLMLVYHREALNLPEEDLRRLRRAQRHYVEEWVGVLAPLRPDLADGELRVTVHAAIGAAQSILFHHSGLPAGRLEELLDAMTHACLGVDAAPGAVLDALPPAASG
jgi:AcrR family transcriptional regulator